MTKEIALHCMKSYSELHSNLCELCPIYGQTGSDHCFEDALQYVIGILEQEPRWIPTSERYPRPDDEYKFFLVTDDKGRVSVQEFYLSLDEEPQPYFSGMTNVVAWMPLPNAYREVGE